MGLLLLAGFLPGLLAGGENSNWPSFRGPSAVGVMAGQNLPDKGDAGSGVGIRFKVKIPGLAHSSPVIWGDRLFVTTAVSSEWYASFKPGLYGSGEASRDHNHPDINGRIPTVYGNIGSCWGKYQALANSFIPVMNPAKLVWVMVRANSLLI